MLRSAGALPAAGPAGDGGDGDTGGAGDAGDAGGAEPALSQHLKFMAIIVRKRVATEDGLEHPREVSVSAGEQS